MQHERNKPFNFDDVTRPVSKYNFTHKSLKILHLYRIMWITRTLSQKPMTKTLYMPLHNQFALPTPLKCEIPCQNGL